MKSTANPVSLRARKCENSGQGKMELDRNVTQHRNPRSQGERSLRHYRKTADDVDLSAEASELQRCRDLDLRTDHVRPVDFVDFDPDTNTLTTELIQGRQLFHTLWNPTYWLGRLRGHQMPDWSILGDRFEELGRWLRLYHDSSEQADYTEEWITWLGKSFRTNLNAVEEMQLLKPDLVKAIRERYVRPLENDAEALELSRQSGPICQVHGDFILYNMLLEDDYSLRLLDFGETHLGGGLEDVFRFYSGLWTMAQTNHARQRHLQPLLDRFIQAYAPVSNYYETEFFRINMAFNFVTFLYGQHYMKPMLSYLSMLELSQISRVGMSWIIQDLKKDFSGPT